MNYVHIQTEPIQLEELYKRVVTPSCGAVSSFIGITRDNFEDRKVSRLAYEAYEPMALKELTRICDDARQQFPSIERIAISHRLGDVSISEISVVIYVSGPHRRETLDAVSLLIEKLKKDVPIWKKEFYEECENNDKDNHDASTSYAWRENK